ncbi:type II toxin-antitoxin system RelE/ParE family toxin [Candidatus Pacearchaeota archaeon]|nr:type II toxin-antitoxin system RelE/ParE family toxin [Candidatus Pacearchaeota archaeon]
MVKVIFAEKFEREFKKFDESIKIRIRKQIGKIIKNPKVGKPMRYNRKGTREVYIAPFRLSYAHSKRDDALTFLEIYHKREQ